MPDDNDLDEPPPTEIFPDLKLPSADFGSPDPDQPETEEFPSPALLVEPPAGGGAD